MPSACCAPTATPWRAGWQPAAGQALEDHLYLVDPMGEWMMRVPADPEPAKVKRDLDRLLRASASWDRAGAEQLMQTVAPLVDLAPLAAPALAGGGHRAAAAGAGCGCASAGPTRRARLAALTALTLFLTFDLIVFGAFTRLTDSGLGCPDWPGCYGSASPLGARQRDPCGADRDAQRAGDLRPRPGSR